jgi:hypothetical protein
MKNNNLTNKKSSTGRYLFYPKGYPPPVYQEMLKQVQHDMGWTYYKEWTFY